MFSCLFFLTCTPSTVISTYGHTLSLRDALPIGEDANEGHLQLVGELAQPRRVEGGVHRVDEAIDGQGAARGDGRRRGGRSLEVQLALRSGVAFRYPGRGVADHELFEQVAALGRVEEVGGQRRVEREGAAVRSEEHTSELQSLMRNSYDVFCLKKKTVI